MSELQSLKMTLFEGLKFIKKQSNDYVTRELLSFHTGFSKEELLLNLDKELNNKEALFALLNRYKNYEPLEYITGRAEFLDREFYVEKGVLIPRFESEILVKKSLELIKKESLNSVFEIGIGSGVLSISLKLENANLSLFASDISKTALKVSKINQDKFQTDILLFEGEYLANFCGNVDLIISNPPYIKNSYKLDEYVLNEPKEALFGGVNGDEILKNIIDIAKTRAKFLICEIGYDQKPQLLEYLEKSGFSSTFYKDLQGFDRGFVARNKFAI